MCTKLPIEASSARSKADFPSFVEAGGAAPARRARFASTCYGRGRSGNIPALTDITRPRRSAGCSRTRTAITGSRVLAGRAFTALETRPLEVLAAQCSQSQSKRNS